MKHVSVLAPSPLISMTRGFSYSPFISRIDRNLSSMKEIRDAPQLIVPHSIKKFMILWTSESKKRYRRRGWYKRIGTTEA